MASPPSIFSLILLLFVITADSSGAAVTKYQRKHIVGAEGDPRCESWKFHGRALSSSDSILMATAIYRTLGRSQITRSPLLIRSTSPGSATGGMLGFFDVDDTLLSNLPYYTANGYGSKPYNNDTSFKEWVNRGLAPPLPMSLRLYKKLKDVGFKIFLLTGRSESQRNMTHQNLVKAGYSGWEKLILRGAADEGKKATIYKSEKRGELIKQGYVIHKLP